jgi:HPt (histidine-containing phosphotransfer) domain-containing protein
MIESDTALLKQMVDLFDRDHPAHLTRLDGALDSGDASAMERAAHALKGMIGNFSQGPAHAVASRLEALARENNLGEAVGLLEELKLEIERLRDALHQLTAEVA